MRLGTLGDATMDVGDWPRSLGLGEYEVAFRESGIDNKVLSKLTSEDLKELGVAALGIVGRSCRRSGISRVRPQRPPPSSRLRHYLPSRCRRTPPSAAS